MCDYLIAEFGSAGFCERRKTGDPTDKASVQGPELMTK